MSAPWKPHPVNQRMPASSLTLGVGSVIFKSLEGCTGTGSTFFEISRAWKRVATRIMGVCFSERPVSWGFEQILMAAAWRVPLVRFRNVITRIGALVLQNVSFIEYSLIKVHFSVKPHNRASLWVIS